ncbi:MAG: exopolysaccharide biosynthesis protein [Tabrizicola sp.]|uniref:exopolysaccharide biosynthesis protein n=1 Tax=Tabrizicola sp. TaxID=2005166 RepID=UPI002735DC88|nr:exopolysaccharide biosynthesis protein [Tabrizicola sp.]MDP3261843.1 exopolysaccharide biosynthesis protein [Tabrizicola sp.]MDP3649549.1 exopolysaccharide biosynthesis protein [Paracoccaceae bacterium]MDZ4069505.1 exopolysaccharide biosynthesis protein [Tabrizicola sp.]
MTTDPQDAEPDPSHRRAKPERKRLSVMLDELAGDETRDRIAISDLVVALQLRAYGALLLIFALPNVLPAPPGTSGLLGLPLLFIATQMMLGRVPWFPQVIAARSMSRADFGTLIERVSPLIARTERLLQPRLMWLSDPVVERGLGAVALVLALVLVLPVPFGNMLPAFTICVIALGVLERDGVWIVGGLVLAVVSVVVAYGVIYVMLRAIMFLFLNALT